MTEWLSLWASLVAQMITNLPEMQENWIRSLGQEDSPEKGMANTPVFLPGKFHGQRRNVMFRDFSGSVPVPSQSIKDPRDLVKTNPECYNLKKILCSVTR